MHGGGTHGINYNIFTLSSVLHPHLAVIDGFEGMEGTGPVHGAPISQKVCLTSLDWLAADRIGAELMGVDVEKIGYLKFAIASGNRRPRRHQQDPDCRASGQELCQDLPTAQHLAADHLLAEADGCKLTLHLGHCS